MTIFQQITSLLLSSETKHHSSSKIPKFPVAPSIKNIHNFWPRGNHPFKILICTFQNTLYFLKIDIKIEIIYKICRDDFNDTWPHASEKSIRNCDYFVNNQKFSNNNYYVDIDVAICSYDASVSIWNVQMSINNYNGSNDGVESIDILINKVSLKKVLFGHENEVKHVQYSPSGKYIATVGRDRSLWVYFNGIYRINHKLLSIEEITTDYDKYEVISVLSEHDGDVKRCSWISDEEIVSVSYDGSAVFYRYNGNAGFVNFQQIFVPHVKCLTNCSNGDCMSEEHPSCLDLSISNGITSIVTEDSKLFQVSPLWGLDEIKKWKLFSNFSNVIYTPNIYITSSIIDNVHHGLPIYTICSIFDNYIVSGGGDGCVSLITTTGDKLEKIGSICVSEFNDIMDVADLSGSLVAAIDDCGQLYIFKVDVSS